MTIHADHDMAFKIVYVTPTKDSKKNYELWCEHCEESMYVQAKRPPTRRKHTCGNYAYQRQTEASDRYVSDDKKRRRFQKYEAEGMNKDQATAFYNSSLDRSKRAIEGTGGASHYKAVVPDMDYMVKNGIAKKMSDSDHAKAEKIRKDTVVKHAGNKKNFNVKRSNNSQSSK